MPQLTMRDVFMDCQEGLHSRAKHVKNLTNVYNSMTLEEFWPQFLHHLKYNMIVFKRHPAVERTIEFVARFATCLAGVTEDKEKQDQTKKQEEDEEEEFEMHPLLTKLFDFLLQSHKANDKAVRFRVCQLVNKLLNNLGEEAQIDDDLYDRIYECMLERMRDKKPIVRVHAILAINRLQDPNDHDCPVINAYLFIMKCDPSADARRTVLSVIAASTKTLPAILERTRDVDDSIRKQAYIVISEKVNIRALTIAQRVRLLQEGLTDRTEVVRDACASRLLQAWLRTYQGNILELLECFDVENSLETSELALDTMLKKSQISDLVQNFDILNDQLVMTKESLTCESVLYWKSLCQYLQSLGTEGEAHLERVLPSVTVFSNYIKSVFESMKTEEDLEAQLRNEFILQQLLSLASVLDLSDEAGRKHFGKQLRELLMNEGITHTLVKPLVARYSEYQADPDARVAQLIEIISEIREPITIVETGKTVDERRQMDLKLARVRVELNQLREELDQCVEKQEFARASEVKARVTELDEIKLTLLEESKPLSQEVRTEKTDPQTLLKCLTIACEMQQDPKLCRLSPALQTLIEVLILPGIQSEDAAVRNMAIKALGMCCLLNRDLASDHLVLFMQVSHMDQEGIKVTALQVIFDLLLLFGLDAFGVSETDADTDAAQDRSGDDLASEKSLNESGASDATVKGGKEDNAEKARLASNILTILINLLDSECTDVRTVAAEGLCKLLLAGRVVSTKLVSHLLLLWYNPVTEGDGYLRHCLGTFFPMFAFASRTNQEVIEEAFMPTLNTLFEAPDTSPLAEINTANVADLLVQLTNSRLLVNLPGSQDPSQPDNAIHCNIAIKVCNSILSDPKSFNICTLCKVLNRLELSNSDPESMRDLAVLAERMNRVVKDKLCLRMLERFQRRIKSLLKTTDEITMEGAEGDQSETDEIGNLTRKLEETQVETTADMDMSQQSLRQKRGSRRLGDPSRSFLAGTKGRKGRSTAASRARKSSSSESDDADEEDDEEEEEEEREVKGNELENSVFGTPTPIREGARAQRARAAALANTRKNLEEMLSDTETQSDGEAATESNKRVTRSTRSTRSSRVPLGDIDNGIP